VGALMSGNQKPLVSFITGTYERPDMVAELIQNIRDQHYRPLEHCIVAEPSADESLNAELREVIERARASGSDVPIKFVELGRWWSGFLANSISAVPFQVAQWLSSGEILAWSADDERFTPDHVEKLVALLEKEQADFAYPLQGCYWRGAITRHVNWIGTQTPMYGQITHALYSVNLLDYRGFEVNVGSGTDWDQVKAWMKAGARWAFLEEKTMSHRVDKAGDTGARLTRQPLRGHTAFGESPGRRPGELLESDCVRCGGISLRTCWCHGNSGSDNKPCRCERAGLRA
jgi:glycosyltransferase involved in cell wall biosynthesis